MDPLVAGPHQAATGVGTGSALVWRMALVAAVAFALTLTASPDAYAASPQCGNGNCEGGESCSKCPNDCCVCGTGTCDPNENCNSCPSDCGACGYCGDGQCDGANGEDCSICPADCGSCSTCGDNICIPPEDCNGCPNDCGSCPTCGDGVCEKLKGEDCSCASDCGACPVCGNAVCESGESCGTCSADCICAASFEQKPLILILFDSSGSMEYTPAAGTQVPVCDNAAITNCVYNPPHLGHTKSRSIVAKEVLTGRLDDANYMCCAIPRSSQEPDPDIPFHYEVHLDVPQTQDGIMDVYREDVRFGLLTFDAEINASFGVDGGFSFGEPVKTLKGNGPGTWNWGSKSSSANRGYHGYNGKIIRSAGGLKAVAANEDVEIMAAQNDDMQEEVRWLFSYGRETPIAGLIDDARYYILDDQNIQGDPCLNDLPLGVILVTDGHPSFDECFDEAALAGGPGPSLDTTYDLDGDGNLLAPTAGDCNAWPYEGKQWLYPWWYYQTSERQAAKLLADTGFRTYVIGFMTGPKSDAKLRAIAHAGGTCPDMAADDCYIHAENYESLYLGYDKTISIMLNMSGIRSKTKPVTTTRTSFRADDVGMYEITSRFTRNNRMWSGDLERVTFRCDSNGELAPTQVVNFADTLAAMAPSERNILTSTKTLTPGSAPMTLRSQCSNIRGCDSALLDFMDGTGQFDGRPKLADISHANPVIGVGPELDLNIAGYKAMRRIHGGRDTMLYAAANDGMLHAFVLGDLAAPAETEGTEKWAYVPRALHNKLEMLPIAHQNMADGTPIVRDVRLYKDVNATPKERWATVLVAGLRAGGRAYYALDVTDPENPRYLWEINASDCTTGDQSRCDNNPESYRPFMRLGATYGTPTIGNVVLGGGSGSPAVERAVAILPGGLDTNSDAGEAQALFVVDMATGNILRVFDDLDDGNVMAGITGSPTAYPTFPGTITTRVFVGDQKGRLLRADLSSTDPAKWSLKVFYDPVVSRSLPADPEPAVFAPAVAKDRYGNLVVVYGTGDISDLAPIDGRINFVASISEQRNFDLDNGTISISAEENWFASTKDGSKLTGEPLIFNNVAYFASLHAPPPDPTVCQTPFARLHAVHFTETDGGGLKPVVDLTGDGTPDRYIEFASNTIIFGVEITARPSCIKKVDMGNGVFGFGGATNSKPQLVVQTSGNPFAPGTTPPTTTSTPPADGEQINKVRIDVPPPPTALRALSWSLVYQ